MTKITRKTRNHRRKTTPKHTEDQQQKEKDKKEQNQRPEKDKQKNRPVNHSNNYRKTPIKNK